MDNQSLISLLDHQDPIIRSASLHILHDRRCQDIRATRQAIRMVEKYGWEQAYHYAYQVCSLGLDAVTAAWAADQLHRRDQFPRDSSIPFHLFNWLVHADLEIANEIFPENETPHEWSLELGQKMELKDILTCRQYLNTLEAEACISLFEEMCEYCVYGTQFPHALVQKLGYVSKRLAELSSTADIPVDRWLGMAQLPLDFDTSGPEPWLTGAAIRLAGNMRHEPAVPRLLELLPEDWDWWSEEIEKGLSAIGSSACLRQVLDAYPHRPWEERLFLTSTIQNISDPEQRDDIKRLQEEEKDAHLRLKLAKALLNFGSPEDLRIVLNELEIQWQNPESEPLKGEFCVAQLIHEETSPELTRYREQFTREIQERQERLKGRKDAFLGGWPEQPKKKVGRNDPCPCGSGKKFKKCCLGKN